MATIYKTTEKIKRNLYYGRVTRDIEFTENGNPEPNRVKIKVVLNNIHQVHYKKNVKQVVIMI